jgi:protein TonB
MTEYSPKLNINQVYKIMLLVETPPVEIADNQRRVGTAKPIREVRYLQNILALKMEKNARMKAQQKLFRNIGFFIAMTAVVAIFHWKTYDSEIIELQSNKEAFEEMLDIPMTEQPPPPPPQQVIQQPNIVEVANEEQILEEIQVDFDVDITVDEVINQVDYSDVQGVPEEKAEEVFLIVENAPEPKMGMAAFMEYLYQNINYPQQAIRLGIQGKVFVQFIVNSDGTLTEFKVIRGIGAGCDEEALRVLQNAEPWNPGKQRGRPVRVRMVIPIHFMIQEIK